jgi:hypothetical protein
MGNNDNFKDDLWKSYAENFETIESARRHWRDSTLEFLVLLADETRGNTDIPDFNQVDPEDWNIKDNVIFKRQTDGKFEIGDHYLGLGRFGFDSFPGNVHCHFYTHVQVFLKNNYAIRKNEKKIVRKFVEEQTEGDFPKARLEPSREDRFFLTVCDATKNNFDFDLALNEVKQTFEAMKILGEKLDAYNEKS